MKKNVLRRLCITCAAGIGIVTATTLSLISSNATNATENVTTKSASVTYANAPTQNYQTISTGQLTTGETTNSSNNTSYTTNNSVESSPVVEVWMPKTAEEKKYYSYVGTEKLNVTSGLAAGVKAANSVQGPLCQKVFESVLGDYAIARTYNIFPAASNLKNPVYELSEPVQITMEIPKSLQKEGRTFELICVSKGIPYVFSDTDTDITSITIETKYFYAYALCYKDI